MDEDMKEPHYGESYRMLNDLRFVQELHTRHLQSLGTHVGDLELSLEGGCGPGLLARKMVGVIPSGIVMAIDNDEQMKQYWEDTEQLRFSYDDTCAMSLSDRVVQWYVSNNVAHFIEDPDAFFSEAARVLSSGGVFSVSAALEGCDVEVLIREGQRELERRNASPEELGTYEELKASNRARMDGVRYTPPLQEVQRTVRDHGFDIVSTDIVYLNQNYHIVAIKA